MSQEELLQTILTEWAINFVAEQKKNVANSRIKDKEELIRSFNSSLAKVTADAVGVVFISFRSSGRYQDMRRLKHTKGSLGAEGLQDIKKWIQDIGISSFTSRYKRRRGKKAAKSTNRMLNDIAWGIMKGQKKKRRRKPWYNKKRERQFDFLIRNLSAGYAEYSLKDLKAALEN